MVNNIPVKELTKRQIEKCDKIYALLEELERDGVRPFIHGETGSPSHIHFIRMKGEDSKLYEMLDIAYNGFSNSPNLSAWIKDCIYDGADYKGNKTEIRLL